jgi:hypothetical protein
MISDSGNVTLTGVVVQDDVLRRTDGVSTLLGSFDEADFTTACECRPSTPLRCRLKNP